MEDELRFYHKIEKLGAGTYGIVYKAIDERTKEFVAMKEMRLLDDEIGINSSTLRECSILRDLRHTNIVGVKNIIITAKTIVIVLEYLDFNLRQLFIKYKSQFEPDFIRSIAFQLLAGIYSMHIHRIIHRDLKPENLLMNMKGELKICDFGLSRYFTIPLKPLTPELITIWYRPPEMLLHNESYEVSVDVWSAGCIIAELTRRKALFPGDSDIDMIHKIFAILGTPPNETLQEFRDFQNGTFVPIKYEPQDLATVLHSNDPYFVDLISKLLVINPRKRITAKEALHHPFFDGISQLIIDKCVPDGF